MTDGYRTLGLIVYATSVFIGWHVPTRWAVPVVLIGCLCLMLGLWLARGGGA